MILIRELSAKDIKQPLSPQLIKTLERIKRSEYYSFVAEEDNLVVGLGALSIENKFIHECGKVGHVVELVARDDSVKSLLLSRLTTLAKAKGCYKVILNCPDEQIPFFTQQGFINKGACMTTFHTETEASKMN